MTEHQLTVTRTARYFQAGEIGPHTRHLWLVCHGYGQLAGYFVRHFAARTAADPGTVVVAPEGLSRFYLQGTEGRVGASWMTRDDRLAEIDDHCAYLSQLLGSLRSQAGSNLTITVLGFSQGTATVGRWLVRSGVRPARLVLWAGGFPDDLDEATVRVALAGLPVTLVAGAADEYVSGAQVAALQARLTALGAVVDVRVFAGGHTLDAATLAGL